MLKEQTNEVLQQQRFRLHRRGVCVVIPTYNNIATIKEVVERTKLQCEDVIVVNDGSTDETLRILDELDGVVVVNHEKNKGKGAALRSGFRKALELGFAYAITLDSDGQHYPEDISLFLGANIETPGSIIIGQRKGLENVERSGGSKFANAFSNFWFTVQTGVRLNDTQTGYRLYPLKKLKCLSLLTSRYEAELELLVFPSWNGVRITSIPVNVYYPPKEERVSHFRPALDFTRISILNTFLCVLALIYGLPMFILRTSCKLLRTLLLQWTFVFFALFVITPQVLLFKRSKRKSRVIHNALHKTCGFIVRKARFLGIKCTVGNAAEEKLSKPAVMICNHQSSIDLLLLLSLKRDIIVLTNDRVWRSPVYGFVIRNAEFYPVSMGVDELLPNLKSLVDRGFMIAVYPEGTRSETGKIARFHKGAFYLAESLKLDILPLTVYGASRVLPKGDFLLSGGFIHLEIGERMSYSEYENIGTTKDIASYFRHKEIEKYDELCDMIDQKA